MCVTVNLFGSVFWVIKHILHGLTMSECSPWDVVFRTDVCKKRYDENNTVDSLLLYYSLLTVTIFLHYTAVLLNININSYSKCDTFTELLIIIQTKMVSPMHYAFMLSFSKLNHRRLTNDLLLI